MDTTYIIGQLANNGLVFKQLLETVSETEYKWKPSAEKWCLLEVVCHLYDEERDDFRARLKHVLENPSAQLPPADPVGWVKDRDYPNQDYKKMLDSFLTERQLTIDWLGKLQNPKWDNAYIHPKYGPLSASMIFTNWLAHDYLHIRQIIATKYQYLKETSGENLYYAGKW